MERKEFLNRKIAKINRYLRYRDRYSFTADEIARLEAEKSRCYAELKHMRMEKLAAIVANIKAAK